MTQGDAFVANLLGMRLGDLAGTAFFQWFHLGEVERRNIDGGVCVSYRPTGDKFRTRVLVEVEADAREIATGVALWLERGFIADRFDGAFARDIAKSFLRDVPAADAAEAIADLANLVEFDLGGHGPVFTARRPPPLPEGPVPGYEVFRGAPGPFETTLGGARLTMSSEARDGRDGLVIRFAAAA
jgi:hypothetical protein